MFQFIIQVHLQNCLILKIYPKLIINISLGFVTFRMPRRGEKTGEGSFNKTNKQSKVQKQEDDDLDWGLQKNEDKSESWQRQQDERQQSNNIKCNTSIWILKDDKKDEEQTSQAPRRGKQIHDTSIINLKAENQKQQLQPDIHNTSWMITSSDVNNKDAKDNQDDNPNQPTKRRGNRHQKQSGGGFVKKSSYFEDRDKKPNNDYNNNYNQNYGEKRQYRGGRGRGGYRGGYRNNNDGRYQTNGQNNSRYREKQQKTQYFNQNKRDTTYNYNKSNKDQKESIQNQDSNRPKRGNRYQNKPTYQNRNHYQNKNNYYQHRNNYGNGNNHYNHYNKQQPKEQIRQKQKEKQKQKQKSKDEVIVPKGRKCWPESSIYILGCKFSITFRPLNQFKCKLLIIPYTTVKMEYYPGNIINSSQVDYKKKIISKGQDISGAGNVYMQKAIQVGNFTAIGFLKVDEKRKSDSLKIGIRQVLKLIQRKVDDTISLQSLIFPICEQLGHIDVVIKTFLDNLEQYRKIKEVYIISNSQRCFIDGMNAFTKQIENLLNANEILIS